MGKREGKREGRREEGDGETKVREPLTSCLGGRGR